MRPKYALLEVERRWLVDPLRLPPLDERGARRIDDLYVADSRLRLRAITRGDGSVVRKLCKKYGGEAGAEPITNIYLDATEYARLDQLAGARLRKTRYSLAGGSLDIFAAPCAGLAVFEVESPDVAVSLALSPPAFVGREVTGMRHYSGAAIARATQANASEWARRVIYHLTTEAELERRLSADSYLPDRFALDGFIHCSAGREMTLAVAHDYFGQVADPVVVLEVAAERLSSRLVFEAAAPIAGGGRAHLDGDALFPHVYGPLDRSAILGIGRLQRDGGVFVWPATFEPLERGIVAL